MTDDDRDLVRRALAPDGADARRAFRALVERHERLVAHVVGRLVTDPAAREDVGQEVFVRVWRGLPRFRGDARLATWIARVAHHAALDHLDRRRSRPPLADAPDAADHLAAPGVLPDERAALDGRDGALHAAVAALPPAYRTVLTLFHLDGFSHAETAEALGLPVGTVKSYLFRARRTLKDALLARHPADEWR